MSQTPADNFATKYLGRRVWRVTACNEASGGRVCEVASRYLSFARANFLARRNGTGTSCHRRDEVSRFLRLANSPLRFEDWQLRT
jgi:hypothetical protein